MAEPTEAKAKEAEAAREAPAAAHQLELLKFELERSKHRMEVRKWVVISIGASVSSR